MMDETNQTTNQTANQTTANETERAGFCQDCGRPLTAATKRNIGSAVLCEPCLQVRQAGTAGYTEVPPAGVPYAGVPPTGQLPPFSDNPSPVLAALLGLIPGVGAMYNGQFAKGIAHIVIFALLHAMERLSGVFDIAVAGWIFYQVFEAYHTAKARREGRPLPDPFGLNNIGEQMGFNNWRGNWTPGTGAAQPAATAAGAAQAGGYPAWTGYVPATQAPFATQQAPAQPFGAPQGGPEYVPTGTSEWGHVPTPPPAAYPPWSAGAPVAPAAAWTSGPETFVPMAKPSTFPVTAVWLIGLGLLFLLLTLDSDRLSVAHALPFFLAAMAVWIFMRRMAVSGGLMPMEDEGSGYAARAACRMRVPVILFTVAVLLGLSSFGVVRFHDTWPVLLIVGGLLMLVERSVARPAVLPYPAAAPVVVQEHVADAPTDGVL